MIEVPFNGPREIDNNSRHGAPKFTINHLHFDSSIYTLTAGEAAQMLLIENCKHASIRKVQRICQEGVIDCHKLSTTRNGKPITEWLVSETSLRNHIEQNETKWNESRDVPPIAAGNANQSPSAGGVANTNVDQELSVEHSRDAVTMPDQNGDASGGMSQPNDQAIPSDATAAPGEDGDVTDEPIGETRNLASVLIENAKLTAQLQGTQNLVDEMREDKNYFREELTRAQSDRKDVTDIARQMLETLETIAVGGKLMPSHEGQKPDKHSDKTSASSLVVIPQSDVVRSAPGDNPTGSRNPYEL